MYFASALIVSCVLVEYSSFIATGVQIVSFGTGAYVTVILDRDIFPHHSSLLSTRPVLGIDPEPARRRQVRVVRANDGG